MLSENCIRARKGYCRVQWDQTTGTTPDSFQLDVAAGAATTTAAGGATIACGVAYVNIPDASLNGVSPLPLAV